MAHRMTAPEIGLRPHVVANTQPVILRRAPDQDGVIENSYMWCERAESASYAPISRTTARDFPGLNRAFYSAYKDARDDKNVDSPFCIKRSGTYMPKLPLAPAAACETSWVHRNAAWGLERDYPSAPLTRAQHEDLGTHSTYEQLAPEVDVASLERFIDAWTPVGAITELAPMNKWGSRVNGSSVMALNFRGRTLTHNIFGAEHAGQHAFVTLEAVPNDDAAEENIYAQCFGDEVDWSTKSATACTDFLAVMARGRAASDITQLPQSVIAAWDIGEVTGFTPDSETHRRISHMQPTDLRRACCLRATLRHFPLVDIMLQT